MPRTMWSLFAANIAVFQLRLPAPILGPPVFVATNFVDFQIIIAVATSGHISLNIVDATNVVDLVIKIAGAITGSAGLQSCCATNVVVLFEMRCK